MSTYEDGVRDGLSIAAALCRKQAEQFLSPQYAANQPFGSICERFACQECERAVLQAIEKLPAQSDHKSDPTDSTLQSDLDQKAHAQ